MKCLKDLQMWLRQVLLQAFSEPFSFWSGTQLVGIGKFDNLQSAIARHGSVGYST